MVSIVSSASNQEPRVAVDAAAAHALQQGHPWVWNASVHSGPSNAPPGTPVAVTDAGGHLLGHGLWDPTSPLAVRMYPCGPDGVTASSLATLVKDAIDRRDGMFDSRTTAYRLCNGEGDRVPGVVLDQYGSVVVARLDGNAIRAWSVPLLEHVWEHLRVRKVKTLALRLPRDSQTQFESIAGSAVPDSTIVVEHGVRLVVPFRHAQKTGAFLDQRENRRRIGALVRGGRVLNLFSYTGGFSIVAALSGAHQVVSVDVASEALDIARETFRINGCDIDAHVFAACDAYEFLSDSKSKREHYDLVISDPPSFAPNAKSVNRALRSYARLHRACVSVLTENGTLCAASCSSHVTATQFLTTLSDQATDQPLMLRELHGLPPDHPTTPAWVEGRYLKFAITSR